MISFTGDDLQSIYGPQISFPGDVLNSKSGFAKNYPSHSILYTINQQIMNKYLTPKHLYKHSAIFHSISQPKCWAQFWLGL